MNNPAVRNLGILIARVGIGIIFLAHGWQKAFTNGLDKQTAGFESMGVPLPGISAFVVTWLEIIGGLALIVGAAVPIFGILLFLDMVGAFFIAHIDKGIFASEGGYELVLALGVSSLLLAVVGSGAYGVDGLLGAKLPWAAKDTARV
ncbi:MULTISPECIES: DoxX family protein [Rhodococcus]|jgi:putative oxidoreductase|uniref:DoxX family protein n=1 Tax=Rhodococcus oxybenzonivorans TaxID=1990687 RepID=A0AAE4UW72_9NOCA|nr:MULTISPECIES: DoxX family protein [Rhodococcus]MDV7243965.1 DoxX family protein [Rhodococcus oxybenzonivorans]MDV7263776.1 DoxX family protein [Rhodococcus oxybenzonivorans]MDV7274793.1 DoxX family protein [Rhodococcus oxybenzonivorans]MDV7345743.1 DoxX family protein [Rhodococcus oxybenzonivorans]MDV8028288.1 DoxX family protein [Rhodococcus sp. IEGM 27]